MNWSNDLNLFGTNESEWIERRIKLKISKNSITQSIFISFSISIFFFKITTALNRHSDYRPALLLSLHFHRFDYLEFMLFRSFKHGIFHIGLENHKIPIQLSLIRSKDIHEATEEEESLWLKVREYRGSWKMCHQFTISRKAFKNAFSFSLLHDAQFTSNANVMRNFIFIESTLTRNNYERKRILFHSIVHPST